MPDEVARHYESLLARHYSWMAGLPFAAKIEEQRALLALLGLAEGPRGLAIDLGCGPGFQSLALAQLGFARVLAVDTSLALLAELGAHRGDLPVDALHADLRDLESFAPRGAADAVVCMGDTLPHLPSRAAVSRLFLQVLTTLAPGGRFVLSFRDLGTELTGTDRIIPVRADAERIMTCLLEFEPESVLVTDMVHTRDDETWLLAKSSYRKLRLRPSAIAEELAGAGYLVERSGPIGPMHVIVARQA